MIHSENSSAVAYLQNQGCTHSLPMFHLTWEILLECQLHGITLLVRHIPGRLNVLADGLSRRLQIIGTEWSLHPSIVRQMFSIWFIPEMGLFATRHNNKLTAFVSSSRPLGSSSGCSINSLGPALGICLSSNCADATGTSQVGAFRPVSNAAGGSTSTLPAVASNAPRVACGLSTGGAAISATPEITSVRSVPQPSRRGSSVRMELIERGLRERQFSEAVAHRLCQTVRAFATGIYDCKWRVYESWCRAEQISPLQATVQQLAEFLEFLFSTRKLAPSTIKGYRSAISTVFRLQGGWNPGTDPILSSLLRAFDIEQPRSTKVVPQWDLALVLQAFLEEPFEPL